MGDWKRFSDRNRNVFHHWAKIIFQIGKTRVHVPVKNIALEQTDNFFGCVNPHRLLQTRIQIIDEYRQGSDMVHVRMSDDYVFDEGPPIVRQSKRDTAGVNRYAVVD
jgi:hypothetical protein